MPFSRYVLNDREALRRSLGLVVVGIALVAVAANFIARIEPLTDTSFWTNWSCLVLAGAIVVTFISLLGYGRADFEDTILGGLVGLAVIAVAGLAYWVINLFRDLSVDNLAWAMFVCSALTLLVWFAVTMLIMDIPGEAERQAKADRNRSQIGRRRAA